MTFRFLGGSNWDVLLAGSVIGESTNNAAYAGGTELGTEMAVDTKGQVWANAKNWQFSDGNWAPVDVQRYSNTPGNPPGFYIPAPTFGPTDVTVHTPAHKCGTTPLLVPQPTKLTTGYSSPLAAVRSIAARATARYAAGTPTAVTAVRTTRGGATALDGSAVIGAAAAQPVYPVQELGSFSVDASSPAGAQHNIRGGAMEIVISATTGQVLDWGIQPRPDNLRSLGAVSFLGR